MKRLYVATEFKVVLFPYLVLTILAQIKTKMNKLTKILAVVVTCLAIGYFLEQ
jgi:hypothetical protein